LAGDIVRAVRARDAGSRLRRRAEHRLRAPLRRPKKRTPPGSRRRAGPPSAGRHPAVGTPAARATKSATQSVPIVFDRIGDPVGSGLVTSLARPGGNLTGLSILTLELGAKRLELLITAVPDAKRLGVLWRSSSPTDGPELREIEGAARSLKLEIISAEVPGPDDFEPAVQAVVGQRVDALLMVPGSVFAEYAQRIADLTASARLPSMFFRREFVEAGGLMSYGPNLPDMFRRAAVYVDKILKGAKPADLPVEQP